MPLKAPCLNCPDRTIVCHSNCELYINYKKENDKIREEKHKINQLAQEWYEFKVQRYKKFNKRR